MRRFIVFFILVIISFSIKAQKQHSVFVQDKIHTGYIINNFLNYDSFPKLSPALINEFNIGHKTFGEKKWHQFYNYPEISLSFFYGNLGNKQQFGQIIGLVPKISFDVKKFDNSSLKMTFGWGFSYFNKPFDSISNPHNILVGSNLNHFPTISLFYQKYLGNNFYLNLAGAYVHSSNGHYQIPNGGLNLATFSVGLKKYFTNVNSEIEQKKPEKRKKGDIYLNFGYGIHEFAGSLHPIGSDKYDVFTATLLFGKHYNYCGKYFIGFSAKYYKAFNNIIITDNIYDKNININSSILTFILGNEFQFGNFSIFVHGGLNIFTPFIHYHVYKKGIYYYNIDNILELFISTKLGMRYYFFNPQTSKFNIYTSLAIKANFGNADFSEISVGFVF